MTRMSWIFSILILGVLTAGCAGMAADLGFERVDSDDDDLLSTAEFREFMDDLDVFERYDDDDDGELDEGEYAEAVEADIEGAAFFRGFDRDSSGGLNATELSDGLHQAYDGDNDGWLNEDEFEAAAQGLAVEL